MIIAPLIDLSKFYFDEKNHYVFYDPGNYNHPGCRQKPFHMIAD